ncbi:hypothetical protein RI367_000889 [Sorochytrium milnesiophthora]
MCAFRRLRMDDLYQCVPCDTSLSVRGRSTHERSTKHAANLLKWQLDQQRLHQQVHSFLPAVHVEHGPITVDAILNDPDDFEDPLGPWSSDDENDRTHVPSLLIGPVDITVASPTDHEQDLTDMPQPLTTPPTFITDTTDFHPFASHLDFLLYCLVHSQEWVLSDRALQFVWHILEVAKVHAPSLPAIRKLNPALRNPAVVQHTSIEGIPFSMLNTLDVLECAISIPVVWAALAKLPRQENSHNVSEVSHTTRFRTLHEDVGMCRIQHGNRWIAVGDLVEVLLPTGHSTRRRLGQVKLVFDNGDKVAVQLWLRLHDWAPTLQCDVQQLGHRAILRTSHIVTIATANVGRPVHVSADPEMAKVPHGVAYVPMGTTEDTGYTVFLDHERFQTVERVQLARSVNIPATTLALGIFSDDAAGNKSKKWNAYENIVLQLLSNTYKNNQQLSNLLFCATVKNGHPVTLVNFLANDLKPLQQGVKMLTGDGLHTLVAVGTMALLQDNPRGSHLCSHLGAAANLPCRWTSKERLDGVGEARSKADRQELRKQLMDTEQRLRDGLITLAQHAIHIKTIEALAHARSLRMETNTLFDLSTLDPFVDSVYEPLHSVLLGIIKYATRATFKTMTKANKDVVASKIDPLDWSGWPRALKGDAVIRYNGSFVGRDFTAFVQIAPWVLRGTVCDVEQAVWVSTARLSKLLYSRDISDLARYAEHVSDEVAVLRQAWHAWRPDDLKQRVKFHLLLHLPAGILLYGPPLLYQTEKLESMNGSIRATIPSTNKLATSRDTAMRFSSLQGLRHLVQGGLVQRGGRAQRVASDALLWASRHPLAVALYEPLKPAVATDGTAILVLSGTILALPAIEVGRATQMVHRCIGTCGPATGTRKRRHEQQDVVTTASTFCHDPAHNEWVLNTFLFDTTYE